MYPVNKNLPFYASLRFIGLLRYYPLHTQYNKKYFYLILVFWLILWGGNNASVGVVTIVDTITGKYGFVVEDIAFFFGHLFSTLCCVFFAVHHKKWSDVFQALIRHEEFGVPPTYEKIKKRSHIIASCIPVYSIFAFVVYVIVLLYDEDACEKMHKGQRVCAVLNPTWWPSQIEITVLAKRLIMVYQVLAIFSITCTPSTTFVTYEACELIVARADHLGVIFKEICLLDDPEEQFRRFRLWVLYHKDTIRLCEQLNRVSKRTTGHLSVVAALVLACLGHQLTTERSPKSLIYPLVYISLVFSTCYAGQIMETGMMSIGDSVYSSEWYRCNMKIRELVPFIILRCQHRIGLDALPFGSVNYALFVMIMKTTYSYLGLLNQSR